ncbi:MAG: Tll0287-like domain-containing protein [Myxococcota bacterium]
MRPYAWVLGLGLLLLPQGCDEDAREPERAGEEEGPPAPPAEAQAEAGDAKEQALERARTGARTLGQTLKGRLLAAMEEGGAPRAMEVCADEAQQLARGAAERTGTTVGRSSLRLRNPDNAPPDWVRDWLVDQGERKADGVEGFARVESAEDGEVARVLVPIAVEGPCVSCHGPREELSPEVRALLDARYPEDEAVGYGAGDLRGALYAEAPVR